MDRQYTVYAYERNQISMYTVLGEADSRTVSFVIIEKSGVAAATSNAAVTNQYLDLTGYTVSLRVIETGAQVQGVVYVPASGIAAFTLPDEFTESIGTYQCEIVLTKNDEILKIIGITLTVDYPVKDSYDITITAGVTDGIALTVCRQDGSVYILSGNERLLLAAKCSLNDTQYVLQTTAVRSGDQYVFTFEPEATAQLSGSYRYGIVLESGAERYPLVRDAAMTVLRSVIL